MSENVVRIISTPQFISEKKYVFDVLIKDFFGLSYSFEIRNEIEEYVIQKGNYQVIIPDVFFSEKYKQKVPEEPVPQEISVGQDQIPSGKLPAWFLKTDSDSHLQNKNSELLPADIIGMAFFLMSGYADIHFSEKDVHLRNKGSSSFLVRNKLIDRPIIQEWFTVIARLLCRDEEIRPGNQIPRYSKHITHDVDQPFEYLNYTKSRLFKRISGDLIARKSVKMAKQRWEIYQKVKGGNYQSDPYNNFLELFKILQANNITSTFFFAAGKNESKNDVLYDIRHDAIKSIIKQVYRAGHKIGLHPSYETLDSPEMLKKEQQELQEVCNSLGLDVKIEQARKHYLRWDWEKTPRDLQNAGINHDYTVGYADRAGYRSGVAFPYRGFSWDKKESLAIKLHPLIVMEASLYSEKYMGLSLRQAEENIVHYHNQLQQLGGEFVLLWHNHELLNESKLKLFKKFLSL